MKTKKTTLITHESHETVTLRWGDARPRADVWCAECAAEVPMLTPEEAVAVTAIRARDIYRLAEAGRVHHAETSAGLLVVCLKSLLDLPPAGLAAGLNF